MNPKNFQTFLQFVTECNEYMAENVMLHTGAGWDWNPAQELGLERPFLLLYNGEKHKLKSFFSVAFKQLF